MERTFRLGGYTPVYGPEDYDAYKQALADLGHASAYSTRTRRWQAILVARGNAPLSEDDVARVLNDVKDLGYLRWVGSATATA